MTSAAARLLWRDQQLQEVAMSSTSVAEGSRYKRIKLESASESSSSISDTESIYSLQGKETECARDTVDTSDDNFEFEVADLPDSQNILLSSTDESELQDIAELGAVVATLAYEDNNLDIAIQADTSEENSTSPPSFSDVDPELPRSDYLDFQQCLICKTEEKDISYPYCPQCFMWKKSFFPPRPEKRRKKEKEKCKQGTERGNYTRGTVTETVNQVDRVHKSCGGSGSQLSSQESSFDEGSYNVSHEKLLCETCFMKRMNGVFIHGTTGHMHSCYNCAKKTWKSIGVCPLCRKKCQKVIKLYTSFDGD